VITNKFGTLQAAASKATSEFQSFSGTESGTEILGCGLEKTVKPIEMTVIKW
jgi:hypothetical protein